MALQVQYTSQADSFFDTEAASTESHDLISAQVDPTQPQVQGLSSVTDPLVADLRVLDRMSHFDPDLYDLTPHSHLMRLMRALLGAAGVGGLRRQQTINRMTSTLNGTHFTDLDGFWGALFDASRMTDEQLPMVNDQPLDPSTTVADTTTWETAHSRDGKYRSRIEQLAQAFAQGATYSGVKQAAEAILGTEVDLIESWIYADMRAGSATTLNPNTYLMLTSKYGTYGGMSGVKWGDLVGGTEIQGDLPLGNRGEVTITPKRLVSEEERLQLVTVLSKLAPAGVVITVQNEPIVSAARVLPRYVVSDSNDWQVTSSVTEYQGITTLDSDLYPNQSGHEAARPAFAQYSGESWSYNGRIAHVASYQMVDGQQMTFSDENYQTVTFNDGGQRDFKPGDGVLDPKKAALARLAQEGVLTNYPYPQGRFS